MNVAMIPARMGSQRLPRKNLQLIGGVPLVTRAIWKCREAACFDAVWVNSEDASIGAIAREEDVHFHERPSELANNEATSEEFVYEFLKAHACDHVFQVHTIAPLLGPERIREFVTAMSEGGYDVLLSCVNEQIECAYRDQPVNFTFEEKTNSQDLDPIQRVTWAITGWRSATFIEAHEAGQAATYAGKVGFMPISRVEGHVIKTAEDLAVAKALLGLSPS